MNIPEVIEWIRNHYQDYPNIDSLCAGLLAASTRVEAGDAFFDTPCPGCGSPRSGGPCCDDCDYLAASPPAPNAQAGWDSWKYEASEPATCKDHLPVEPAPA